MPHCPVCQTQVEAYTETYTSPYNKQEYEKYECPHCEVHWWEPLKIIPEFYEDEVFEGYIGFHEGMRLRIGKNHEAFFKNFPGNLKGRLLDVGCGDGVFLKEAQRHGFEVWGIDFDKKSVEVAKRSLGVETVYAMSLEEFYRFAKEKGLKFDVITFFEVLEHQDSPMEFLRMVRELLKEGGYMAGSVPNRERLFAKTVDWKYFHGDYPPHHFLRFSDMALKNTLEKAGFNNVEVIKTDFLRRELYPYIEKKLFGNLDRLKVWLKGKAVGNEHLARAVTVEDLERVSNSKSAYALKILKKTRNLLLFPLTIFYLPKLKGNGINLYFQGVR
ncbi:MAG TPA: hypothetical protein DIT22_01860 [Thermodesulfobacterium commune]|nr:hypothetical protein [Thermodesulfobacterium commune]